MAAGAQLVRLSEAEGRTDGDPEDDDDSVSLTSDPDLGSTQDRLGQVERDWSGLLVDVTVVQQSLHQVRLVEGDRKEGFFTSPGGKSEEVGSNRGNRGNRKVSQPLAVTSLKEFYWVTW